METEKFTVNIDFPTATEGPFYGIIYGSPSTVTIMYDSSQVPPEGPYEYLTNNGGNGNIIFEAGTLTFAADMDNSHTIGWPIIQFDNGAFSGLSYFYSFTEDGVGYQFTINGLYWEIANAGTNQVVASGTITP